jgi:hypothetical protein
MNLSSRCAGAAISVLLSVCSAAPARANDEARVTATSCKALTNVQERIVGKADQGIDALRSFVWMTKLIYGIGMLDVAESLDEWRAAAVCAKGVSDAAPKKE